MSTATRKPIAAVAAAALLAFFAASCQRDGSSAAPALEAATSTAPAKAAASLASFKTGEFKELDLDQDLSLPTSSFLDAEGKERTMTEFKGKVVVLNIWAEWCAPCVEEMPTLAALQNAFPGGDVIVAPVAFGYPEAFDSAKARLAKRVGADLPFFYDSKYNISADAQSGAFPSTIIYGRDGKEAARLMLPADWGSDQAKALVQAVVDGGA